VSTLEKHTVLEVTSFPMSHGVKPKDAGVVSVSTRSDAPKKVTGKPQRPNCPRHPSRRLAVQRQSPSAPSYSHPSPSSTDPRWRDSSVR
jgi:hypothetical protein